MFDNIDWRFAFFTFGVCVCILFFLRRLAFKWVWLDHPGEHKTHAASVPVVGGIAIMFALAISLIWRGLNDFDLILLLASCSMLIVGMWDDRFKLSAKLRFILQACIASVLWYFGLARLEQLGALFGGEPIDLGVWSFPFTVFALVGCINALNLIDGIDGLSGSMVLIALLALTFVGGLQHLDIRFWLIGLGSAVSAFLIFNSRIYFPRAIVFMGDAGTLALGTILAVLLVRSSQGQDALISPVVALWFFALPLIDAVSVMLRRFAAGASAFQPDQRHLHHLLLRVGLSDRSVCFILVLISATFALIGVIATRYLSIPDWLLASVFLSIAIAWHQVARNADRYAKLFSFELKAR